MRFALLAAALAVLLFSSERAAQARPEIRWLLSGRIVEEVLREPAAARMLDGTAPFIAAPHVRLPAAWNAVAVRSFASYRALETAFGDGTIDPSVQAVMYDNESWRFTPRDEQLDPATFERRAAQLVHAHGLLFIAAPATDLVAVLAPGPGRRYDAYLRLGLAAQAARYADVYDIQSQGSERNVPFFASFVRQAAAQARAANPRILVLAGISTNPSGQRVTADGVLAAIAATRDAVDGYWLNVPSPGPYCPNCNAFRPDMAIEVLRRSDR